MEMQNSESRFIRIGTRRIDDESHAYLIAEVGHNHGGSLERAEAIIRMAAAAGADAVKLQKRDNRAIFTEEMYNAAYVGRNSFGPTYGAHREALEFDRREYEHLADLARELSVDFFATAFDPASVDFLCELGVPAIKIASGDLTNTPLLVYAAQTGRPLIVSTGGAEMDDVRRAVDAITAHSNEFAFLQCTAAYPALPEQLNLSVIQTLRNVLPNVVVGFSSHEKSQQSGMIAYALGARIIEKHVTCDCALPGSDHHFSLEGSEIRDLVESLRLTRTFLGNQEKRQLSVEGPAMIKMAKKLVASRHLPAGHVIAHEDIAVKSPGDGLRPYFLDRVVGQKLRRPLDLNDDINLDDLS